MVTDRVQAYEAVAKERQRLPWHEVQDYKFRNTDGNEVTLRSLFGDKKVRRFSVPATVRMGAGGKVNQQVKSYCSVPVDTFSPTSGTDRRPHHDGGYVGQAVPFLCVDGQDQAMPR